jgi:8-amino-7-oxononanoate synthase
MRADPARDRLLHNADALRALLKERGISLIPRSFGPIVAVLVGESERAVEVAQLLRLAGVLSQAIRPPTVPDGFARLRITVSASHSDANIRHIADSLSEALSSTL